MAQSSFTGVHFNTLLPAVHLAPHLFHYRIPYVLQWRGLGGIRSTTRLALRALAKGARLNIVSTDAIRLYLEGLGVPAGDIVVVPNAIPKPDVNSVSRERAFAQFGLYSGNWTVGMVGRAIPDKDFATGVRAFSELSSRGAELLLVATGTRQENADHRAYLRRLCRDLGVERRVSIRHDVYRIEEILSVVDILWNLATKESFGRVVAEAASVGIPTIGRAIGGVPSVLGAGGLHLSPRGSADEVAHLTDRLLDDHSLYENLTKGGKEQVCRFRPEVVGGQLMDIYKSYGLLK
jgi:glycosyltransferase involved in cell wall biosynthesis